MNPTPIIHVVDDDESFRTAMLRLLGAAGFEAHGYGSTGDFLLHPTPDRPGCVLLDLRLPGGPSGLDLQAVLESHGALMPVIFLSGHADVPSTVKAMKAGAVDFLTKPVEREELFGAIHAALARDAEARASRDESGRLRALLATLTPREREILDLVAAGKLNKQIAADLAIAERTVKLHRAQMMDKLGVGTAAALGRLAERLRPLSGEPPATA
jgi:FixJ family two-component response regulator